MDIGRHGLTELYAPKDPNDTVAHVIFIHGLFGHPYKTWARAQARSRSKSPRPLSPGSSSSLPNREKLSQNTGDQPLQKDDCSSLKNEKLSIDEHDETIPPRLESSGPAAPEISFWPKTLLPSVIPNARIFTWGYDADVHKWLSSASQNNIHQHAGNLLVDLSNLRTTANDHLIPLIFVVHSLGGIIVKDALSQSSVNEAARWKCIAPATFGIIFLGTPHRGSKSASLGLIAYHITQLATRRPNLRLLKGLERNSETLDRIGDSFLQTINRHKIRLCTFREELETRKYLIFSTMVVNADSAKLGVATEELSSIPSDHSNMTKFSSDEDIGFKRVSSQLRRWIEEIDDQGESRADCLKSLDLWETRRRIKEVQPAHEKTFHWLFDPETVPFQQWLRGDEGSNAPVFWVRGKPGSGKSTLMKFALQDPRTLELLGSATRTWKLVAFFFHDRGSDIQRSLDGMMQETLHSILQQHPPLLSVVTPLYLELVKSQGTQVPTWDTSTLQTALLNVARVRKPSVRLCLFLDALDEHGGDNEKLAMLLKEMVSSTDSDTVQIKVCVASREWPVFTKNFGNCPGFAIHEHTVQDISSYVTSRLAPDNLGSQHLLNSSQLAMIAAQVTEKSSGVFIWVRLVVDQLSKIIQDGTPLKDLENYVMEMPPELEDLYAHTLRRIDVRYCNESYIMLQIAFCSISPLSLEAFMECTSHNQEKPHDRQMRRRLRPHQGTSVTENTSLETQLLRLASRSGGLLEAVSSTARPDMKVSRMDWQTQDYHVQFIHQTAKEYVRKYRHNLGLAALFEHIHGQSGNYFLLSPNVAYHATPTMRAWMAPLRSDLWTYAKRLESSIDPAHKHGYCEILRQTANTCTKFDLELWLADTPQDFREYLFNTLVTRSRGDVNHTKHAFTVLAVAANLVLYVQEELHRENFTMINPNIESRSANTFPTSIKDIFHRSLLHIAVAGPDFLQFERVDHRAMIETLVESGCAIDEDGESMWIGLQPSAPNLFFLPHRTPLAYLLTCKSLNSRSEERRLQIARTLLKLGANVNARICFERDGFSGPSEEEVPLLEYCVRYDSASFVRLLLQHGAQLQLSSSSGFTMGNLALLRGDKGVIQALKDRGIPLAVGEVPTRWDLDAAFFDLSHSLPLFLPHGKVTE